MSEVYLIEGFAGDTAKMTSSDEAQGISSAVLDPGNNPIAEVEIFVEDANIRYAFGVDPVKSGDGKLGALFVDGNIMRIRGYDKIGKFRFISDVENTPATLQVMPTYRKEL